MKGFRDLLKRPWIAAGLPALAALTVALPIVHWGPGPTPWGLLGALLGGLAGAAVVARAVFESRSRPSTERAEQMGDLIRRLSEIEASAPSYPNETFLELEAGKVDAQSEEPLDEVVADLGAALQDEERLRERRRELEPQIQDALRRGRELGGHEGEEQSPARMPSLLNELKQAIHSGRELSDGTLQNTIACEEISRFSLEHAQNGKASCVRAGRGAEELQTQIELISKLVHRLEARSQEIGQVLIVLNDITEQTNLLALNAAIIAAQAGEHGKGFGVVADEMRNLSERASSSTKETEMLSQTLQGDMTKVIRSLADTADVIQQVRSAVSETSETTGMLVEHAKKSAETIHEAVSISERQASGIRDLAGTLRLALEEWERVAKVERELHVPSRGALRDCTKLLEGQWQMGNLRESLRKRLEAAVEAVRKHRGLTQQDRERVEEELVSLQNAARGLRTAIQEGKRRDDLVREFTRAVRKVAAVS